MFKIHSLLKRVSPLYNENFPENKIKKIIIKITK